MNQTRNLSGICVDTFNKNRVYMGGGRGSSYDAAKQKVEYYDISKNIWIEICDTNGDHKRWPVLWFEDDSNNILNIASTTSKLFEKIDLREANKWNTYIENENFNNLFGVKITNPYLYRLCVSK